MGSKHGQYRLRILLLFLLGILAWGFDEQSTDLSPLNLGMTCLIIGLPMFINRRFYSYEADDDPFVDLIDRLSISDCIFAFMLVFIFPDPIGHKGISILLGLTAPLAFCLHVRRVRWVFFMNVSLAVLFHIVLKPYMVWLLFPYAVITVAFLYVQSLITSQEQLRKNHSFNLIHISSIALISCFALGLMSLFNRFLPELPRLSLATRDQQLPEDPSSYSLILFAIPLLIMMVLFFKQARARAKLAESQDEELTDKADGAGQDHAAVNHWGAGARAQIVNQYRQHLRTLAGRRLGKNSWESAREYSKRLKIEDPELEAEFELISTLFEHARYDPEPTPKQAANDFEDAVKSIEKTLD
jgi:hypothetical protein